jgi:CBS domain containing-hemolysin-like protein
VVDALIEAGQEEGILEESDRDLIQSVVEFGDKTVREVMTPRPELVAIDADSSADDLRRLLIEEEYSRVPVYEHSIDNVIGFVRSRDVLEVESDQREQVRVRKLTRPVTLVPESKPIRELMPELQQKNAQMAIVVDEYGQTAGLVTMEDMMEEIVGEIRDESEPEHDVMQNPDGSFVASGNLDLDRLQELAGFVPDDDIESTTIGGLVCEHLGQVPDPGARMRVDGIDIEVLSADDRRVRSVRIRRVDAPAEVEPQLGEAED